MFDPNKPIQLRDGTPARVISTDINNGRSIAIAYKYFSLSGEQEQVGLRYPDGKMYPSVDDERDVVNVSEVDSRRFVNIYDDCDIGMTVHHATRELADSAVSGVWVYSRVAVLEIVRWTCGKVEVEVHTDV